MAITRLVMTPSENSPKRHKSKLVIAIGDGIPIADWARTNDVPERTAYRWAREPKVRAAVESYRRRAIDRAVGRMTRGLDWATEGIFDLARDAVSESVKLAALRAVVSDMMTVSKFGGLEDRLTHIEEKLSARTRKANDAH